MGNFDDVRELNDIAEMMDANPDALAEPEPAVKPEVEVEQEQVVEREVQEQEQSSGGLADALEVKEDAPVTVDDILGLNGRESSPVEEQEPAASNATEEAVEPKTSSVEDRLAELAKEKKELREQVDILTKRALQEPATAPGTESEADPASELNDDVKDYMQPYTDAATADLREEIAQLKEAAAPLLKEKQDRMMGEAIAERVEGFKAENVQDLYKELDGMSEEDKAIFGDSFGGAIALAGQMVNRGAFADDKPTKKQTPSRLAARHHSEAGGPAPSQAAELSDEAKLQTLMNMDPEAFLAQSEKMGLG